MSLCIDVKLDNVVVSLQAIPALLFTNQNKAKLLHRRPIPVGMVLPELQEDSIEDVDVEAAFSLLSSKSYNLLFISQICPNFGYVLLRAFFLFCR